MPTDAATPPRAPSAQAGAAKTGVAPRPGSRRGLLAAGLVAAVVALVVVVLGIVSRTHQSSRTESYTVAQAIPTVDVVTPAVNAGSRSLSLPGNLQAYYNAPIYSRVSGYVRAWYFDIGAHVKAGQLLAVIDTPETDEQINQARANLATAQANMELAATTAQRWARLLTQDAVSKQESDEKAGDYKAKTTEVAAAKANLDRYLALKAFSRITAPFDGVITARRTDIGALVNAGAGATTGSELFDVAKVDHLRLYVSVPEVDSADIRPGVSATLTVPELPGRTFPATLSTTADAISGQTGTLLAELMVDNRAGVLKPGAFAQVRFDMSNATAGSQALLLPSSAILFRDKGTEVALVGANGRVHIQHVSVGRDLGGKTEIDAGVSPSDRVINDPPDSIAEGQLVRVVDTADKPAG